MGKTTKNVLIHTTLPNSTAHLEITSHWSDWKAKTLNKDSKQNAIRPSNTWEFPKIGGTLFWGPYNKDPTI